MQKNSSILTTLCLLAITILLALQGYWISKYYAVTKKNFATEVNLAFEDAIKKEFGNRADTIEKILTARLLDTNYFMLTSKFSEKQKRVIYNVFSTKNTRDKFTSSFSLADLDMEIDKNPQLVK